MFKRRASRKHEASSQDEILQPATRAAEFIVGNSLVEPKLEVYGYEADDFTNALNTILSNFDVPNDARVLYPGSSTHMGVAFVFGKERVTHVDPDESACQELTDKGCNTVNSKFEDLQPDVKFDVLVALNSYGVPTPDTLAKVLNPNALIIVNNYTHWAGSIEQLGVANLQGAIFPAYYGPSGGGYVDVDHLPENATNVGQAYYNITRDGKVSPGTPEDHTFSDVEGSYPDALSVFRYNPAD